MTIPLELERSDVALIVELLQAEEEPAYKELVKNIEDQLLSYIFSSHDEV